MKYESMRYESEPTPQSHEYDPALELPITQVQHELTLLSGDIDDLDEDDIQTSRNMAKALPLLTNDERCMFDDSTEDAEYIDAPLGFSYESLPEAIRNYLPNTARLATSEIPTDVYEREKHLVRAARAVTAVYAHAFEEQ